MLNIAVLVSGGGTNLQALKMCIRDRAYVDSVDGDEKTGAAIVLKALEEPVRQIAANAGLEGSCLLYTSAGACAGQGLLHVFP